MSKYYDLINADRERWRDEVPDDCMRCGQAERQYVLDIHEIERKAQAPKRWWPVSGCNGLKLCRPCHKIVGMWGHSQQLALKMIADPNHYDLKEWHLIRYPDGRAGR